MAANKKKFYPKKYIMKKRAFIFLLAVLSATAGNHVIAQDKRDTIHIVGHAHMDMNWLWTYSETMKMCNDNLRQTVAFMEEFPDFTMIQSQAAVYDFVEQVDPPLFELVRKYVGEGRLEPGGGMWTEGDNNLPSGEALARSFLLGQRYFKSKFDKTSKVGWLPDDFGHNVQLPQILKLSGCDYYYFHRTKPYKGSFWWTGPDGSTVLCYANDTYNGDITLDLKDELKKFAPGGHRILQVTGVGDHGGGPTLKQINMVHKLDSMPGYPAVKFTTAEDFFKNLSGEMEGRPTHYGEMQFIFEGCYTSVSDIKKGNRSGENSLFGAEYFNTLRWMEGDEYPAEELQSLWRTLAFNQFHDILPGSAIHEANREAIARYMELLRMSNELRDNAFRKMADEVNFQKGLGQPVVAYNLFPVKRKTIVEATVYSHEEPISVKAEYWSPNFYGRTFSPVDRGQGDVATVLVRDGTGNTYPAQIVRCKPTPPGYTSKIQFVDDDFPAGGYKTYYVDVTNTGKSNGPIPFKDNTFETDFYTIKFDMNTGRIVSLTDKESHTEFVKNGGEFNKLRIYMEDKNAKMKAWTISKIVGEEDVSNVESVRLVEKGPVRACIETVRTWGKSRFVERAYIYRSYPRIAYDLEVYWLETGSDSTDSPMLRAVFPLAMKQKRFFCQVPFAALERPIDGKIDGKEISYPFCQSEIYGAVPERNDGQEVPAQKWVDVSDGRSGIALLNNSKYGHSVHNGELRLTLMRSGGYPDILPNIGKFIISYALYPHTGDWKNGVWMEGDDFNIPVRADEPPSLALVNEHDTRPEEASFFSMDTPGVYMTGLKKAEEGNVLVIRFVEVDGDAKTVNLSLPEKVRKAGRLNLIEFPLENVNEPIIDGNMVSVKIKPYEIVTLGIEFEK